MDDIFTLNASDLIHLRKFCKKAPKQFQHAVAGVLNDQAFGNRRESLSIINEKMTVRNPSFVSASLRVTKARGSQSINQQQSEFGSISKTRSTGFIEQETGQAMDKTRVASLYARGGSESRQIGRGMRLKPGVDLLEPWDLVSRASNETHRFIIFLAIMKRSHRNKSFLIRRNTKGFKRGVYRFRGKKIKRVFDMQKKTRKPERVKWLSGGHKRYMQSTDMRKVWTKQIERQLRFIKR